MYDREICYARIVDVMDKSRFDVEPAVIDGCIGEAGSVNGPCAPEVSRV